MASGLQWNILKAQDVRINKFADNFGEGKEFLFTDNRTHVLDGVRIGSGKNKVDYDPAESKTLKTVLLGAKRGKLDLKIIVNGREKKLADLERTPEYGGRGRSNVRPAGSYGGTKTEVLSEVGFCFYYAMLANDHLDKGSGYTPGVWINVTSNRDFKQLCKSYTGVSRMLSYTFKDGKNIDKYIGEMYYFLLAGWLGGQGWDGVLRKQVKKFEATYPRVNSTYFLSRGDGLGDYMNPLRTYKVIRKAMKDKYGLGSNVDPNKWNPADVWVMNAAGIDHLKDLNTQADKLMSIKSDQYTESFMNNVNFKLTEWYKERSVIPVSLKRSGPSPKIKEINMGTETIEQLVKYTGVQLDSNNQDVKLNFEIENYSKKTGKKLRGTQRLRMKMKTDRGGWRLEIEEQSGGTARHGSIGPGLYQWIIYNTADGGITALNRIRNEKEFNNIRNQFPTSASQWVGVSKFKDVSDPAVLLPYVDRLMREINPNNPQNQRLTEKQINENPKAPINKAAAGELAVAVDKIMRRAAKDITLENLYHSAASKGVRAGLSVNQLNQRKRLQKQLGMTDEDIIVLGNDTKARQTIFNGGPHIKIM